MDRFYTYCTTPVSYVEDLFGLLPILTSTRGSASPLQTIDGHIDCPALDMLLRSISIYSRYPEKLAQGQSSAGATTPTTMFTTVGSAVASGLENQLIPTWTFSLLLNRFDAF